MIKISIIILLLASSVFSQGCTTSPFPPGFELPARVLQNSTAKSSKQVCSALGKTQKIYCNGDELINYQKADSSAVVSEVLKITTDLKGIG